MRSTSSHFRENAPSRFLKDTSGPSSSLGGVPTRISYDNSKVAVGKIVGTREREVTKEFLRLKSHFLYEDHFCLTRRPNEKGHVERLLDFASRSFLVPVPRVESLEELNAQLLHCCEKDLDRTLRGKSASKRELLKDEQQRFLSIPNEQFEARRLQTVHANSLSLIRFDRNSYSVPTDYAHRSLTVIATVEKRKLGGGGLSLKRRRMIKRLAAEGIPVPQIAKRVKCSVATVYRHLPKKGQE